MMKEYLSPNRPIGVILTGIGGQGINFSSLLLRRAVARKFDYFTGSDNHGGAQRYGHVSSIIRFWPEAMETQKRCHQDILAMDIPAGGADLIIALEPSEGLRFTRAMNSKTFVVADKCVVVPTNVRRSHESYPDEKQLFEAYQRITKRVFFCDFRDQAAKSHGGAVNANILALGFGLGLLGAIFQPDDFKDLASVEHIRVLEAGFRLSSSQAHTEELK